MKLFVDDIRNPPDHTWTLARTVTEAIRLIYGFEWKVISLDHDISHYENLDESDVEQEAFACGETFAAVAYFIAEKYGFGRNDPVPEIRLHTSNDVAGDGMYIVLGKAGISCEKKYTGKRV